MKVTKIFLLLSTILLCINIYIFINRDDFAYEQQSAYYELYPDYKTLSIKSFNVINDSTLRIKLNNEFTNPSEWSIKKNNVINKIKSIEPIITLDQGISDYNIMSSNVQDSLLLKIEYYPDSFFKKINSNERNRVTIFRSKIPENSSPKLEKWKNNHIDINTDDLKSLNKVLIADVGIKTHDDSYVKAIEIAQYLCFSISNSKGTPSVTTKNLSTYKQYLAALRNEKIDCGIYAKIFSLFASQSNITNRIIELKHNYGTFGENIHVFNEFYIDETKKWATTDIMLNNIAYVDFKGELMNAVQVKNQAITNNAAYVLKSNIFANSEDSIIKMPFSDLGEDFNNYYYFDKDLSYYYDTNLNNVYSLSEKTKRYFKKNVWSETYSDVKIINNKLFYLKQFFILTLLSFFLVTLISYAVEKKVGTSAQLR